MPAGAVAVAMMREVVRPPGVEVARAFPIAVTAVFPRCGAIANTRLCASNHREVPDDLLGLRAARRAGKELEGVAHGHALLEALATVRAVVFIESHQAMVERVVR